MDGYLLMQTSNAAFGEYSIMLFNAMCTKVLGQSRRSKGSNTAGTSAYKTT
eukprot:m.179545 g.179545  ORF g.179545 m.179545 type:complete len:51 (-) comp15478_c0_seq6:4551-4703(-)